jgi:hypothetical protein
MELLQPVRSAPQVPPPSRAEGLSGPLEADQLGHRAARRSLREQIARLERELASAFVIAFPTGGLERPSRAMREPRLLDLGELECVRDELVERLRLARVTIADRADAQQGKRLILELMLLDPAAYRFARVSRRELGEPGCGVWQVRPRLGLIGMLMGWWQVKLSSGCPLPGGAPDGLPERYDHFNPPCISEHKPLRVPYPEAAMRELLRTGAGALLVVLIMFIGSLGLWVGTPLLWLWVGSQIQGATASLGTALGAMFVGVIVTVALVAILLAKLSDVYRANCRARGLSDPGHFVLEGVLVVSAGLTLVAFVVWFFFFAGSSPVPVGIQI